MREVLDDAQNFTHSLLLFMCTCVLFQDELARLTVLPCINKFYRSHQDALYSDIVRNVSLKGGRVSWAGRMLTQPFRP